MAIKPELLNSLQWRLVGPFRGGRCVAVTGHPTDPQVAYMGTTGGGVWKTTDGGISWENLSDGYFKRASVGGIAISPTDPNVIYVGMGEATIRGNVSHGDGVYKSLDGGETWQHLGLAETRNIGKVRVHPTNPDLVYVAALGHAHGPNPERGVYRSKDGGATWDLVLKRDENAGGVDLAVDPHNPRVIYASLWEARRGPHYMVSGGEGSGLFKTTDGGDTWTEITRNEGLPKGIIGKIGVVVSPARRNRVWALVEAEEGGVFRSDDGGKTWERLSESRDLRQRAWYYTHIFADPVDAETVWVLNVEAWKSTDGGKNFERVGIPHGDNHDLWINPQNPLHIVEGNDGGATISYNGGINWSDIYNQPTAELYHVITDNQQPYRIYGAQQDNTTITVPSKSNIGAITHGETYAIGGGESGYIAIRPDDPNIVYAGSYLGHLTRYDHRTGQARNIQVWPEMTIGAGAEEAKYRFQWTAPIVLSPHDPNTLYITGNHVFRTRDEGITWDILSPDLSRNDPATLASSGGPITKDNTGAEYYATIFSFVESPITPGLFWAGSDDGLLHISRDEGKTWADVTPPDLRDRWALMSIIEASSHDPAVAYLAATRYKLDDFAPYLYKTADYGQTWTKIVDGLPEDSFTRTIKEDTARPGLLYCGTETGIYFSPDDGREPSGRWQPLQGNLPVTPIHDIIVHGTDLVAGTHGRSIWIMDDISPLRQLTEEGGQLTVDGAPSAVHSSLSTVHLFAPRPAIRYVLPFDFGVSAPTGSSYMMSGSLIYPYSNVKDADGQPEMRLHRAGKNPPHGVLVHYALAEEPSAETPVTLTFLSEAGEEIKSFRRKGSDEDEKQAKEDGDTDPRVPVKVGANRFLWDMRHADPPKLKDDASMSFSGGVSGPVVPPGTYRVRLTVGEATQEQSFEIVPDPRSSTSPEDFAAQYALSRTIAKKFGETVEGIKRLRATRDELERWEKRAADNPELAEIPEAVKAIKEKLQAIEDELIQHRAKSMQDTLNFPVKLNAKLAFLSSVVSSGDGKPTKNTQAVYDDVSTRIDKQLEDLADILGEDLVSFNALIGRSRLPAVQIPT